MIFRISQKKYETNDSQIDKAFCDMSHLDCDKMMIYKCEDRSPKIVTHHQNMKVFCILALGLAVVAAELSVDVTPELDRMAAPEDRSVTLTSPCIPQNILFTSGQSCADSSPSCDAPQRAQARRAQPRVTRTAGQ